MADRPLRPATRRCLGEPLPHQLADRPRDPPRAPEHFFTRPCDRVKASGISRRFQRLSRSLGQVSHVLLTRSPLSPGASSGISFDLHVLGTPPAFVLSQDQTLRRDLGHPEGIPRSVLRHSQTPGGVRVGDRAYVERNRRWLQQFASPAGVTRRFAARPEGLTTGSPTPLNGPAFELTEDCRASRNARHLPHSLLRPSLPFSRSNRHGVKTLVCRARCSLGEPEVPSACPSQRPIGCRMGRVATLPTSTGCFNPVSASFSGDVRDLDDLRQLRPKQPAER